MKKAVAPAEMTPYSARQVRGFEDTVLIAAHDSTHSAFGKEPDTKKRAAMVRAHERILDELERRGVEHKDASLLDSLSVRSVTGRVARFLRSCVGVRPEDVGADSLTMSVQAGGSFMLEVDHGGDSPAAICWDKGAGSTTGIVLCALSESPAPGNLGPAKLSVVDVVAGVETPRAFVLAIGGCSVVVAPLCGSRRSVEHEASRFNAVAVVAALGNRARSIEGLDENDLAEWSGPPLYAVTSARAEEWKDYNPPEGVALVDAGASLRLSAAGLELTAGDEPDLLTTVCVGYAGVYEDETGGVVLAVADGSPPDGLQEALLRSFPEGAFRVVRADADAAHRPTWTPTHDLALVAPARAMRMVPPPGEGSQEG